MHTTLDYLTILAVGFLGSFGHCIGMCGGFVAAYSLKIARDPRNQKSSPSSTVLPHILFNLGRVTTYAFLGLIFGFLGQTLGLILAIRPFQGMLQLMAGICMALLALEMGSWLPSFSRYLPGSKQFRKVIGFFVRRVNSQNTYALGILLGFIPCGLIYAVGAKAASSSGAFEGLLIMVFLGVGTFPAMLMVGLLGHKVSVGFRRKVFRFAAALVVMLGILTTYRGIQTILTPPALHGNHSVAGNTMNSESGR